MNFNSHIPFRPGLLIRIVCPHCEGVGYDPNPDRVCCRQPVGGECCGDPEPDWQPCPACRGEQYIDIDDYRAMLYNSKIHTE